jgi:GH24 family phage-related lysozyme (muramidase)
MSNDAIAIATKFIKGFEGCRLDAYICPAGVWTIGWGATIVNGIPVKQGDIISTQEADLLLKNEVTEICQKLSRLIPVVQKWSPNKTAAIVSWAYNVGLGAVSDSTLRRRLLNGENEDIVIKEELPRWNKAGSVALPGLIRRRAEEIKLFIEQPQQSSLPVWPPGMVGPKMKPDLKPGDHHMIANDINELLTAWTHDGKRLWRIPCLCRGQGGEAEWNRPGTDTPPGLYRINVNGIYRDYDQDPTAKFTPDRRAYGWYSLDLEGLEGQEGPTSRPYRDGIMIHGGGSACGWPGAWNPRQELHPTQGCIRLHNQDIRERILPLLGLGTIWISVLQEAV